MTTPTPKARIIIPAVESIIRMDLREMIGYHCYVVVADASDGRVTADLVRNLWREPIILALPLPAPDSSSLSSMLSTSTAFRDG